MEYILPERHLYPNNTCEIQTSYGKMEAKESEEGTG
jgi:hypothetical protein